MNKLLVITVLAIFSLAFTASTQINANVTGTWKMNVETNMGSGSPTVVLKHLADTTITGKYNGQLGEAEINGSVHGNKIRFEFSVQSNTVVYDGTVDGNNMKGSVKLGTMAEGTFTGTREAR
jgi:hypothetical protein